MVLSARPGTGEPGVHDSYGIVEERYGGADAGRFANTDHGIIDVEWHGLFHRESSRVLYSDLQGVSYEIKGIIPTILRTGTISVEKISTGSAVEMEQVYNPRSVETLILKNMEAYMLHKNMKNTKDVQEILAAIVAERAHLREIESDSDEDAE